MSTPAPVSELRLPLRDRLAMLRPPLPGDRPLVRAGDGPPVFLLHGLYRSLAVMEPLARDLHAAGFHTVNLPYPSARKPIPALIDFLRRKIDEESRARVPHFVTHSLGAILVRGLLDQYPDLVVGRVVMLAPPNQGSVIVNHLRRTLPGKLLGPAGLKLGTDDVQAEIPPLRDGVECAVIMGRRPLIPFFRRWLGKAHDGIVAVEEGRLAGIKEFRVVDSDHTFIAGTPLVRRMVAGFLLHGTMPRTTGGVDEPDGL